MIHFYELSGTSTTQKERLLRRAELQIDALRQLRRFEDAEVGVEEPWPAQDVSAGVSERAGLVHGELGGIEPLQDLLSMRAAVAELRAAAAQIIGSV